MYRTNASMKRHMAELVQFARCFECGDNTHGAMQMVGHYVYCANCHAAMSVPSASL